MSENGKSGKMDGLVAELERVGHEAREVFGGLSAAQLNWKPSAEQWSVGQCFDHLIVTNSTFFPDMERVAAGTYRSSLWGRVSPLPGFFARFILKALHPGEGAQDEGAARLRADEERRGAGRDRALRRAPGRPGQSHARDLGRRPAGP